MWVLGCKERWVVIGWVCVECLYVMGHVLRKGRMKHREEAVILGKEELMLKRIKNVWKIDKGTTLCVTAYDMM